MMRSATSAAPMLKRELSDQAGLKPATKAKLNSRARNGASLARSSSMSNLDEPKAWNKKMIEDQLHDAISAIRKPNRVLVGKAVAEEAEKRGVVANSITRSK